MPGLLDITDDPNTAGLLSLGLRLMSTPGKFGTALGQAGLGAMGDLQQARQMMEQRKLREQQAKMQGLQMQSLEQQLADAQRAREEAAALKQTRGSFLDSIDPTAGPAMPPTLVGAMRAGFSPQEAQTFLPPKVESQIGKVDPDKFTPESLAIFATTGKFSDLKPRVKVDFVEGRAVDPFSTPVGTVIPQRAPVSNAATDLLIPGPDGKLVPNVPLIGAKRQVAEAGATRLDINTGENKFATKAAEVMATQLAETYKQGQAATRALGQVNRLDDLLKKTGGGFTPAIKVYAGQFGVNTNGLDDLQAAEAVIQSLIPQQRPPGSGTMSDRDVELFRQSLPRLINQPGGNQKIVNTMRALYEYDQKLGQISSDALAGKISRDKAMELMNAVPNPLADLTGGEDIHSRAEAVIRGGGNGKR